MALPQPKEPRWQQDSQKEDNRIYVLPPWAQPAKPQKPFDAWRERMAESRFLELMRLEVKIILLAVLLLGLGYVGLKGLYKTKSAGGIEVAEPIHAPNLLPFLR